MRVIERLAEKKFDKNVRLILRLDASDYWREAPWQLANCQRAANGNRCYHAIFAAKISSLATHAATILSTKNLALVLLDRRLDLKTIAALNFFVQRASPPSSIERASRRYQTLAL